MSPDAYSNSNQSSYQQAPQAPQALPVETYKEEVKVVQAPIANSDLDDYDGFDIGVVVKSGKPKAGEIDWGDAF